MSSIELYYTRGSPPCHTVLMATNIMGIKLNNIFVHLEKKDHMKPEFLKLNPQHMVPTLVDNGFALWESRAIITYLAEKYGAYDWYPIDQKIRALVNQRLYFDFNLYQRFADAYFPSMVVGVASPAKDKLEKLNEAFEFLEIFLSENEFVADSRFTLADIALLSSVTSIQALGFDISKYSNVTTWLDKSIKLVPNYEEANGKGIEFLKQWYAKTKQ